MYLKYFDVSSTNKKVTNLIQLIQKNIQIKHQCKKSKDEIEQSIEIIYHA